MDSGIFVLGLLQERDHGPGGLVVRCIYSAPFERIRLDDIVSVVGATILSLMVIILSPVQGLSLTSSTAVNWRHSVFLSLPRY